MILIFNRSFLLLRLLPILLLVLLLFGAHAVFAAEATGKEPDWVQLLMGLLGGLALFLSGLDLLSEGLKKAAGQTLKTVLSRLTANRFMGALTGAFVTGVLNSSSVTTVLVVGFVTAGMMSLSQSVGVIMGANIGSTVTAQILAFDVAAYALAPVAVGFFMTFSAKNDQIRYYGMMAMGLGLVFYGMGVMSDAMQPLRVYEPFLKVLKTMEQPVLGILAGALFTALVQSSAATVGIAIAMASEGLLSLPAGIALALGANVGTCVTAVMAALGKPVEAVRATVVHVAFNVAGVLLWLFFIPILAEIAVAISPVAADLQGSARAAVEVPRQIANANTLFNIINTLVFIGFATWFARLAEYLVPDRERVRGPTIEPEFLNDAALKAPSVALQQVRLELGRVGELAVGMMRDLGPVMLSGDRKRMDEIARRDDSIDLLTVDIMAYLGKIRQNTLTEEESREHQGLMTAAVNLEGLADVIESDVRDLMYQSSQLRQVTGEDTRNLLKALYQDVSEALYLAVKALRDADQQAAEQCLALKERIREDAERILARKSKRLYSDDQEYLQLVQLQMAFVDQMRHIYTLSKRVAKEVMLATSAYND